MRIATAERPEADGSSCRCTRSTGPAFSLSTAPVANTLRKISLEPWQEQIVFEGRKSFLRGLIHSDGCRIVATDRGVPSPRYHFSNLSEDIKQLFCESLDALEIRWTRPCGRQIAVYRRSAVQALDEFIGPKR